MGSDGAERLLAGRRVLVVGASAGIGRATAVAAVAEGARVAALARRAELLGELEAAAAASRTGGAPGSGRDDLEAGSADGSIVGVACDVRHRASCEDAVAEAAARLGGLDALVYVAGVNHLALLPDTTAEDWQRLFETNVLGAAWTVAAALAHLRASRGRVGLLSSHSVPDPWPGLGAYAATKAALETLTAAWRAEEPDLAVSRIVIGPTLTGMAEAWDPDLSASMFERWHAEGRFEGIEPAPAERVAERLVEWLALDRAEVPTDLDLHAAADHRR